MKTINIKILIVFASLFLFQACTKDFEKINTNPNAPTADQANPALILPKILYEAGNEMTSNLGWGLGNIVMQLAATNNFTGNDIYSWGTYSGTWNLLYRNMRDAQNLQVIGEQRGNQNMQAVALILKSWMAATLTEMYGEIPYTQALKGKTDNNLLPAYDDQATVYQTILSDYETALGLLNAEDELDGDILFSGDYLKWQKLCAALQFRTVMRLEKRWSDMGVNGPSTLQAIVNKGILMEGLSDNAAIPYLSSQPNQWPLFAGRVGSFDEKRMSQRIEKDLKAINDPRLEILFRPVDNPDSVGLYRGVPNGLSEDNASNFNGGAKNQSRLGDRFREIPDAVEMVIMHYPELQFLLAEAAEKGYISGGSSKAETYYMKGIEATMEYYGANTMADYYTQLGVDFNKNSNESKLELIAKQKWLSLFMVGLEAWFDWRRTGLPQISPGPNALLNEVPVRIQYPDDEQVLNGGNLNSAIGRQGANEITTKMWLVQ